MKRLLAIALGLSSIQAGLAQETNDIDVSLSSADRALELQTLRERGGADDSVRSGVGDSAYDRLGREAPTEPPLEPVYPVLEVLSHISSAAGLAKTSIEAIGAMERDGLSKKIEETLDGVRQSLEDAGAQLDSSIQHLNTPDGIPNLICSSCSNSLEEDQEQ